MNGSPVAGVPPTINANFQKAMKAVKPYADDERPAIVEAVSEKMREGHADHYVSHEEV